MRTVINARQFLGLGFPPNEGMKLAQYLLDLQGIDWLEIEIDLRECPASMLISSFFNGYLQKISETKPELLGRAKNVKWAVAFSFQYESLSRWMAEFRPHFETCPR